VSFVEVILAVAILATAMLPIFGIISSSGFATRFQKAEIVAANLAKEEMNRWLYEFPKGKFEQYFTSPGANQPIEWSLGNPYSVEGNLFEGRIKMEKHLDSTVSFSFPVLTWHSFLTTCPDGSEQNEHTATKPLFTEAKKDFGNLIGPGSGNYHIVDILLKVRWKLPSEVQFNPNNQFVVLARRFFR